MSDFSREDRRGQIDLVSDRDIILESDRDMDGAGDIIFRTGGVERGRVNSSGVGSGVFGGLLPVFNVKDSPYGAVGNGTFDDTGAIVAAIAAAAIVSGIVYFPPGTYKTTSLVTIPSNVVLLGSGPGSVIKPVSAVNGSRQFQGTLGTTGSANTLASDAAEGASSIALSAGQGANFVGGDYIQLNSSAAYGPTQLNRVDSVGGDTVFLEEPLIYAFTAVATNVKKVTTNSVGVTIRDLTFDFTGVTGTNTRGLSFFYALRPVIDNCTFLNSGVNASAGSPTIGGAGLDVSGCIEPRVTNCRFDMCGNTGVDALYIDTVWGGIFANIRLHHGGFHVNVVRTTHSMFSNIRSTYAGWQTSGGRAFKLQSSSAYNSFANIQLHRAHSNGFGFVQGCHHNVVNGLVSTGHLTVEGLWFEGEGSHHNSVFGYVGRNNATWDIGMYSGTDTYNYVSGDFDTSKVLNGSPTSRCVSATDGAFLSVPSAGIQSGANLISQGSEVCNVTGTTTLTTITAGRPGQKVTLVFAGILTVTDGGNLKLAGNFVTTADDTLTLVCDGTNWIEVCRSVN